MFNTKPRSSIHFLTCFEDCDHLGDWQEDRRPRADLGYDLALILAQNRSCFGVKWLVLSTNPLILA